MQQQKQYDTVIIGSGLGGLVCGAILSKEGQRVCVLEKNEQIGGNLQTFKRDGVTFDTGVHYISGLDKGQNLYQFFNYLGLMDRLELLKMDEEGFDVILLGDDATEYLYGMGYEKFKQKMLACFPDEQMAIDTYCSDMQRICNNFPMYNIKDGNEYEDKTVFTTSAAAYFDALTSNDKLRAVLAGTHLLYGGTRNKTPLHVHALVVNSYIESSWRCVKGGDQLAKLLAKSIREAGGDVLRKKNVTRIELENDKAVYVETDTGERFYGTQFISNMHPAQTLDLTDTPLFRKAYRSRIQGIENTVSAFIVNIVLKPDTVLFRNRNYYYHCNTDVWNTVDYHPEEWPHHYALFENVPEKGSAYTNGIILMTYMRLGEVAQWKDTMNTTLDEQSRGEDYERFKQEKAEKLLAIVYKRFPELEGAIQSYYTSTPLSYRDYIGTADGNMYGIAKDFNNPLQTTISPVTKIPNLFLTGASIVLHGVLGVTVGAFITTSCLLGKEYLVNKIRKANETLS